MAWTRDRGRGWWPGPDLCFSIVGGRQLHWEFIVPIKRWSTNLPRVAGQIQVGIMWIKKKERWWWWWFWRVWVLRLRGSGSHSAPVLVPASAAIAQQPHSPWIGAERKEFYSSWHNVDKEKGKMMMMMMILKIKIPGTPSPPRANDPRGRFSVIWDKTQRSSYCNSYE